MIAELTKEKVGPWIEISARPATVALMRIQDGVHSPEYQRQHLDDACHEVLKHLAHSMFGPAIQKVIEAKHLLFEIELGAGRPAYQQRELIDRIQGILTGIQLDLEFTPPENKS